MSSRSNSGNTSTVSAATTRQDSQVSFVKKPAPLEIRAPSQDSAMTLTAPLSASSGQKTPPPLTHSLSVVDGGNKEKKIGHRRVDEQTGQVTYKKKATSDLMHSIQLGIGQSVGSLTSKPTRDVLMQDFSVVESVHFPENGSKLTPAHKVGEFRFKTYAPVAFRYFRELFGIQTDDFLISLTSLPLTELSNPGASGSVFFITEDDEFIIKTVQHQEADFLQKLLPGYYMNLNQNPRTLLPKFYGLYCLQSGGKNIRLCVMNNLLPSAIRRSEKYDLKGSTYKRKASKHELAKSSPTFKDLDFKERNPEGILLESDTYEALMKTIKRDCRVLESFKIMDYSLLLSIYNVDDAKKQRLEDFHSDGSIEGHKENASVVLEQPSTSRAGAFVAGAEANIATPGAITRGRSTKQRLQNYSTAMESIQAEAGEPVELDDEDVPPGGIPARSNRGERLLLYAGVIDILQSYRFKKKLEHGFKSIVYDRDSISVHRPNFYAQRFLTFFEKEVFKKVQSPIRSPSKKKSASRQRSFTDPTATGSSTTENTISPDSDGALLHRNKPDLIPQQMPVRVQGSATAFDPEWSATTMSSTTAYSSSSVSTGMHSYPGAYSKETGGPLSPVREVDSRPTSQDAPPPPQDDPLPPYSESLPSGGEALPPYTERPSDSDPTLRSADSHKLELNTGGARSKLYRKKDEINTRNEVEFRTDPKQTISAPSVLGQTEQTKSSFRRDKTEKVDKKGVRFSFSEDEDVSDTENSELLTDPSVSLKVGGSRTHAGKDLSSETGLLAKETEDTYL